MIYSFVHWRHETRNHHMSLFLWSLFSVILFFSIYLYFFRRISRLIIFYVYGFTYARASLIWLAMAKASIHFSCVFRFSLSHHYSHMVCWVFRPSAHLIHMCKAYRTSATAATIATEKRHQHTSPYHTITEHSTAQQSTAVPYYMFHSRQISRSLHVQREQLHQGCSVVAPLFHWFCEFCFGFQISQRIAYSRWDCVEKLIERSRVRKKPLFRIFHAENCVLCVRVI